MTAKTKTIGEMLREERLKHRIELSELASLTKIKQSYLQALEENRFSDLPAATFIKGYIKTYGSVFGFDHVPLLAILRRDYKQSVKGTLVPRDFLKSVHHKRVLWTPVTVVLIVATTLFLSLLGYVGVQWYNLNRPPALTLDQPTDNQVVSGKVEIIGQVENTDAVVAVNAQPVSLQVDGSFSTDIFLSREGVTTVTVTATDRRGKTATVQRNVIVQF